MVSVLLLMPFVVKIIQGLFQNGGAAHQADVGDIVIIATFGDFTEAEANAHKPRLVYANPDNTVNHTVRPSC